MLIWTTFRYVEFVGATCTGFTAWGNGEAAHVPTQFPGVCAKAVRLARATMAHVSVFFCILFPSQDENQSKASIMQRHAFVHKQTLPPQMIVVWPHAGCPEKNVGPHSSKQQQGAHNQTWLRFNNRGFRYESVRSARRWPSRTPKTHQARKIKPYS